MTLLDELASSQGRRLESESTESDRLRSILARTNAFEVRDILTNVFRSKAELERVAQYAFKHVNGFEKLTLFHSNEFHLRVHLWDVDRVIAENIHDHKWTFASRVLIGGIKETRFLVSDQGDPAQQYRYLRPDDTSPGIFAPDGKVTLKRAHELEHNADSVYTVRTHELHRVEESHGEPGGLTLVLTGQKRSQSSRVFGVDGSTPAPDPDGNRLSPDEVREKIRRYLECL